MAPKSKPAATNGAAKKPKSATPSGTASPAPTTAEIKEDAAPAAYGSGKPDKALYDTEQNKIKAEIDALQVKLVSVPATAPTRPCVPKLMAFAPWHRTRSRTRSR